MWWGTNASCAAPPTAPAISISLEMHRWRQSRPDFPLFGGGKIAPHSAWQQGQDLQQKRLKSQDFRRFHGITTNPLSSSMALVVLLPSPRPVHGHCRSAFATGASARYSSGCISSFPNLPPQRKSPRAFLRIPVPCCLRRAACMAPHFSNHHLLPDPPVQRHRWLLSIRRPCSPVTPAWFWQG